MINIHHSEYEELLSQQEELRSTVRQLREEIELLENGRNCKTSSTVSSQYTSWNNVGGLRKNDQYVFFALKYMDGMQILNIT